MSLIIKKNTTFKIPRTGSGAPILWKVAIFGAGTDSSNGEYVWDGSRVLNGKPIYDKVGGTFDEEYIIWESEPNNFWGLYDSVAGFTYNSQDLITWNEGPDGVAPVPLSALSYSQSSFINSIYFGFDAQDDFVDNILSRSSGGTSEFSNGPDVVVTWNTEDEVWEAIAYGTRFYFSYDLFVWYNDDSTPAVVSLIAGMTYSA